MLQVLPLGGGLAAETGLLTVLAILLPSLRSGGFAGFGRRGGVDEIDRDQPRGGRIVGAGQRRRELEHALGAVVDALPPAEGRAVLPELAEVVKQTGRKRTA